MRHVFRITAATSILLMMLLLGTLVNSGSPHVLAAGGNWKAVTGKRPAPPAVGPHQAEAVAWFKAHKDEFVGEGSARRSWKPTPYDGSTIPPSGHNGGGFAPNVDVQPRYPYEMSEPSIAVNFSNPNNLVVTGHERQGSPGPIECASYVSNDGASTYQRTAFAKLGGPIWTINAQGKRIGHGCADNVVRSDPQGLDPKSPKFFIGSVPFVWSTLDLTINEANPACSGGVCKVDIRSNWSTDGGKSWGSALALAGGTPRDVGGFADPDKEWLGVDLSGGLHSGRIYMCYTDFGADFGDNVNFFDIALMSSDDHGQHWTAPMDVPQSHGFFGVVAFTGTEIELVEAYPQGCQIVVDNKGVVHVIYAWTIELLWFTFPDFKFEDGKQSIYYADIEDDMFCNGGTVECNFQTVAIQCFPGLFGTPFCGGIGVDGYMKGAPAYSIRQGSIPTAALDPFTNDIWVAWAQWNKVVGKADTSPTGSGRNFKLSDGDIAVAIGPDGGSIGYLDAFCICSNKFYQPMNDDHTTNDQFQPTINVDNHSFAHIFFGDRRFDPNNLSYDIFEAQCSFHEGCGSYPAGGIPNRRVTTASSFPYKENFVGDYFDTTRTDHTMYIVWDDMRKGPGTGNQRNTDFFTANTALGAVRVIR